VKQNKDDATVTIRGETLHLLPQRAAYWPAQRLLMIADIHFGKAASFRAKGLPVPRGTTMENLIALNQLIADYDVAHIVFLGDFLHAKAAHASATLAALRAWRQQHSALQLTLVRGNHDSHAGDPPEDLHIHIVNEPYNIAPFALCHHPKERVTANDTDSAKKPNDNPSTHYRIAGHLHPVYRLSAHGDSVRLPCFIIGEQQAILPAFGAFTGGYAITPVMGERVFLTTDDVVIELPRKAR
jgi:DNA ligase-associated metallophosphoesterase